MRKKIIKRLIDKDGYSLLPWVALFVVVVTAILFIRTPFKRGLQKKVGETADYLLWTSWRRDDNTRWAPEQYKGDDNSYVKSNASQRVYSGTAERRGYIDNEANSINREDSVSSGVEEGAEAVLKTVDLNNILPYNE